jgi:hypothetical protein
MYPEFVNARAAYPDDRSKPILIDIETNGRPVRRRASREREITEAQRTIRPARVIGFKSAAVQAHGLPMIPTGFEERGGLSMQQQADLVQEPECLTLSDRDSSKGAVIGAIASAVFGRI